MIDSSAAAAGAPATASSASRKIAALLLLVAAADWLFYAAPAGLSFACFFLLLVGAVLLTNPVTVTRGRLARATAILLVFLLPVVENPGAVAVLFGAGGVAYFALTVTGAAQGPFAARFLASLRIFTCGPPQCLRDLLRDRGRLARDLVAARPGRALALWIMPLLLAGLFLTLFAAANPVIEQWLRTVELHRIAAAITGRRLLFWLSVALLLWSFVFLRGRSAGKPSLAAALLSPLVRQAAAAPLFGQGAILRALILFNALFALQTGLDALYLWGGAALPEGMSYAAYAHRGAYPLVLTALLAGGFVMLAIRPDGGGRPATRWIEGLVYLWIGQNLLLVLSSLQRLDLYVEAYSLTYLRAAAFIWMLLVAAGLVLLLLRIVLRRSNRWLIAANLRATVLTLYLCCFINFPLVIATYNVTHSRDITQQGEWLDLGYLVSLGPEVIPAIDLYERRLSGHYRVLWDVSGLAAARQRLALTHAEETTDWRAWSFREWRLTRYLEETPMIDGISAITLATHDMARAVAFYRPLGFELLHGGEAAGFTSFRAGSGYLNLIAQPAARRWSWWGRVIFYHRDVDGLYASALAAGLRPEAPPRDAEWGERYFHLTDPDGHELSFAWPLEQ